MNNVELVYGRDFVGVMEGALESAKKTAVMLTYRLGPAVGKEGSRMDRLVAAMEEAARRGVKVSVYHCAFRLSATYMLELRALEGRLRRAGVFVLRAGGGRVLHAKAYVFDNRRVILGSHNLTRGSVDGNAELSVDVRFEVMPRRWFVWFDSVTGEVGGAGKRAGRPDGV